MAYDKDTIAGIAEAIGNTDNKIDYYYNKQEQTVIQQKSGQPTDILNNIDIIKIEAMLKDILELMEDFALEQDAEDVQESLLKVLKAKDKRTAIKNFKRVLFSYSKSKKSWDRQEEKWLKERAVEFLKDSSE